MNRSSGAYTKTVWHKFAIVLRADEGFSMETVQTAPNKRMALGMAFRALGQNGKVLMCKTADEMTLDERGRYDMLTADDLVHEARENEYRRAKFNQYADLY